MYDQGTEGRQVHEITSQIQEMKTKHAFKSPHTTNNSWASYVEHPELNNRRRL